MAIALLILVSILVYQLFHFGLEYKLAIAGMTPPVKPVPRGRLIMLQCKGFTIKLEYQVA